MSQTFSAVWLMEQEFPPLQYVVPGVIPEGMTLLVAAPKTGKSWLVLDLAVAVSSGSSILETIHTGPARPVLYLALEDGPRRLQDRLRVLGVTHAPHRLFFGTSVPQGDVLSTIQAWVDDFPGENPVVILDTLGKVMPSAQAGESDYQRDYRVGGALKGIVDGNPGAALIVVHHTRKAQGDDFLDSVSGTQGLAGSADSILVLRRGRAESAGSLSVTSRDAAEGQYQVELVDGKWRLDGNDLKSAAAALAETRTTSGLGERSAEVVSYVNENPAGVRAADVAEALRLTSKDAGTYLLRAFESGRINRPTRGLYTPVGSVGTVGTLSEEPTQSALPTPTLEEVA
ncbi:hypothetical protein EDM22_13800 [Agromyces tardus]|uniref:AAA family ATPase n=1 Tax=Agromyces tardus TaxID=2583849 RepID=A0A3M8A5U4_9MICO|nr:AAA family ATPase [Agromyces tardus]RNB46544.1 hypothetical protein EDM22_13800 [Agromyces tardus]